MDRLKTYVEGFDEALGGGIPRGSIVLAPGTPAWCCVRRFEHPRRDLFHFFGFLKSLGATAFLVSEVSAGDGGRLSSFGEGFLSDRSLVLRHCEKGETDVQLRMRCVKMRRARHEHGYYALIRNNGKFQITRAISE